MELQTFQYTQEDGWSIKAFPEMDSENTLILIFAAPEFDNNPAPIVQLAKQYPQSKIIGCSSAGEIFAKNIYDHSLSVAIVRFEKTKIKIVKHIINSAEESFTAGKVISAELFADDLRGIFVLSEGLQVNGSELVKGFNTSTIEDLVVTGGLAGDGSDFKQTWVIFQGEIYRNMIVAVGLYGEHIQIGHASRAGWDILGPERHITRSKNNILYELNEQPALDVYKKILGTRAAELPASGLLFPLAIRKDHNDKKPLIRTLLGVDEKEQALIFAGDMPSGYLAQLMRGNFNRLIVSASEAAEAAFKMIAPYQNGNHKPVLSIAISCVGRRLLLGERTEEETESVLDSMLPVTQQIGFYSYGELSPFSNNHCDLHNQTMTLTVWYEI